MVFAIFFFGAYYYILELELSPEMGKLIYKDLYWQQAV